MAKVKIVGLKELDVKLKKNVNLDKVKRVVRLNGSQLQTKAQRYAPVGTPESTGIPGYVGGTLKRGIGLEIKDAGMTAESEAAADYAPYVEWGTRYMEAQPFMRLAFYDQKEQFEKDMKNLAR